MNSTAVIINHILFLYISIHGGLNCFMIHSLLSIRLLNNLSRAGILIGQINVTLAV